jgi:hypothetical protein
MLWTNGFSQALPEKDPLWRGPGLAAADSSATKSPRTDQPADASSEPGKPANVSPPETKASESPGAKPAETSANVPSQAAPQPIEAAPADLMGGKGNQSPSETVVINLINRLVKKGLLDKEEAAELLRQAEQDAAIARVQTQSDAAAVAQEVVRQAVAAKLMPESAPPPEDAVRVTYIPEIVKKQIRDELRADIAAQAKQEKWASAVKIPDWVAKFRVKGDIRLRYEGNYFPGGNDNTGAFPNFNAINTGAPFDVSGTVFSPQLNVDQDRERYRLRLRLGAEIDLGDNLTAGVRLATGQDNSPTSPNQSFGLANNASGGNFSKYSIWLDRGFLKYEASSEKGHFTILGGRFDNPFFSTDMIYDEDLGFDGVAIQAKTKMGTFTPFLVAGAFPIFNTDFNFSSNQPSKFESTDKYLFGGQIGTDIKLTKTLNAKLAVAYYDFNGVRGEQSTPYTPLTASDAGDTDGTRPSFAQKGNTYIPLRRIIPNANNNFGTSNQFQYFGLGTNFQPLAITGKLEYNGFEPIQVAVTGEYIRNLGFDRARLNALGVNNRAPQSAGGTPGAYAGGDTAWTLGIRAGSAVLQQRGDWQVGAYYKHIEADAVVDAFNDSDFGLGGTNMEGFGVFGTWALSPNAAFGVRWISVNEIAGPPLRNDTLQVDFSGKF